MRTFQPKSEQFDSRQITRDQRDFSSGMISDLPAAIIPQNAAADLDNYIAYPNRLVTRKGNIKYSATTLPVLRTGYSWTKSGTTLTKTAGTDFSASDVGRYVIHDDGSHERITAYTSTTVVTLDSSTARAASTAGQVRGRACGRHFHEGLKLIVLHIGGRIYVSPVAMTAWTRAFCGSEQDINEDVSVMCEYNDYVFIFTSVGIFKMDLNTTPYIYYQINSECASTLITAAARTASKKYGRRYTYTMSRLTGTGPNRTRTDSGVAVELQSGPCTVNSEYRDFGECFTTKPIGDPTADTYQKLTGGTLGASYDTAAEWAALPTGAFTITIDGQAVTVLCDFTSVTSMEDVAGVIQEAIRAAFVAIFASTEATCIYVTDHFVIENPIQGGTLTVVSAATVTGYTDIGTAAMSCQTGTGTVASVDYYIGNTVGTLTQPTGEQLWTHYTVNCTLDVGENGIDPLSGEGNNSEAFVFSADVPICKPMVASRSSTTVTATVGTFQRMDVGSTIYWQDGTSSVITVYTNTTTVTVADSGTVTSQAAGLGYGTIRTASQATSGTETVGAATITKTGGTDFASGDVGKTAFWADGKRSTIVAYLTTSTVEVAEDDAISSTACIVDPVSRKYHDAITDDILRSRLAGFAQPNRFWQPLPDCDAGVITNGFLFGAVREGSKLYYSQMPAGQSFLAGYYNEVKQVATFPDAIQAISEFPDRLVIYCTNSTYAVPTNTYEPVKIESVGEVVAVLSAQYTLDTKTGVKDFGSIAKIDKSLDMMICNDLTRRFFNGTSYSENLDENRTALKLETTQPLSASVYHKLLGYMRYCTEDEV